MVSALGEPHMRIRTEMRLSGGRALRLSGRYNCVMCAIDTGTGRLRAEVPVGKGPDGLCPWPQRGRSSVGHTGILR
jgi:hypothetical protein